MQNSQLEVLAETGSYFVKYDLSSKCRISGITRDMKAYAPDWQPLQENAVRFINRSVQRAFLA
jgi:hypothetical protein